MAGVPLATAWIKIRPELTTFSKEVDEKVAPAGQAAGKKHGHLFGTGFAAAAGGALGAAIPAITSGARFVINAARSEGLSGLKQAAKDAGISWTTFGKQVEDSGRKLAGLGFDQGEVNKSLQSLVTSTGSAKLATQGLGVAADYARFKHVDLATASAMLAKAATGSSRALREVGISSAMLPKNFSSSKDTAGRFNTVLDLMNKKIGGQSVAYTKTFGGHLDQMKAQLTNAAGALGRQLLPALSDFAGAILPVLVPLLGQLGGVLGQAVVPLLSQLARMVLPPLMAVVKPFAAGLLTITKLFAAMPGPVKWAAIAFGVLFAVIKSGLITMTEEGRIALGANPWLLLAMAIVLAVGLIVTHWKQIKAVFEAVWGWIAKNIIPFFSKTIPDAFGVVISWVKRNWPYLLGALTGPIGLAVVWIIKHWSSVLDGIKSVWGTVTSWLKGVPGRILSAIGSLAKTLWQRGIDLITGFLSAEKQGWIIVGRWLGQTASRILTAVGSLARTLWQKGLDLMTGFLNAEHNGWVAIGRWLGGVGTRAFNAVGSLVRSLFAHGQELMTGLGNGIISWMRGIGSWINAHVVQPIVGAVKSFFHISSPSQVMAEIGGQLIAGLLQGIIGANPSGIAKHIFGSMPKALGNLITKGIIDVKNLGTRALQAAGSFLGGLWGKLFGGGGGSGVGQWAGVILQALKMLGQPASWLATVERRMNQESGGNASVVNRWDSNWKAGTPSVGLMQVIGPTFQAYAGPFRGVGPFMYGTSINPLANTYAGLNYALHAYGSLSALNRPGGYARGGFITEPIMGIGASGRHYTLGEEGIETVVPGKFSSAGIEALLRHLIGAVERNAEQTGDVLAAVLNGTARRAMYSSAYGVQ